MGLEYYKQGLWSERSEPLLIIPSEYPISHLNCRNGNERFFFMLKIQLRRESGIYIYCTRVIGLSPYLPGSLKPDGLPAGPLFGCGIPKIPLDPWFTIPVIETPDLPM